jgi:hypothetical protein
MKFIGRQMFVPIPATSLFEEKKRIGGIGSLIQAAGINISAERRADVKDRLARQEHPDDPNVQRYGYRGLTPEGRLDFEGRHPEIFAASERDLRQSAENGDEWAIYMVNQMDAETAFNDAVTRIGEEPDPARRGEMLKSARTAYGAQLAKNELDHPDMVESFSKRPPLPGLETNRRELMDIYARFTDPKTGLVFDPDSLYEEIDDWEGMKTEAELEELAKASGLDRPLWYQERQDTSRAVNTKYAWFDLPESMWQEYTADDPELAGRTFDEVRDGVVEYLVHSGKAVNATSVRDQLIVTVPTYRDYETALRNEKERLRKAYPELDAWLLELGSVSRPLTEAARAAFKRNTGMDAPGLEAP